MVSFEKVDSTDGQFNTFYPMTDHLGSVALLAESPAATGGIAIAEYYTYSSFGKPTAFNSNREKINNFTSRHLFTGREYIPQIDLYDYRNRFYSADLGRFLQTDPIGFDAGDGNLYRYVFNLSNSLFDPYGLEDESSCLNKAKKAMNKNKDIKEMYEEKGCSLPIITCKCCDGEQKDSGGYHQGKKGSDQITICYNNTKTQSQHNTIVRHELIHGLQACRGQSGGGCSGSVCSEIESSYNSNCANYSDEKQRKNCTKKAVLYSSSFHCKKNDGSVDEEKMEKEFNSNYESCKNLR